jgi:two-component system response regulator AtoC
MIQKGEFRQDLFYRLNVVPIWLPPLRERPEEIELLAHHFCASFAVAHHKPNRALEPDAIDSLRSQVWPGNVRQLQNLIERLVIFSDLPQISASDVQRELARDRGPEVPAESEGSSLLDTQRLAAERQALTSALQRAANNRSLAARLLGISRRTLYNKLEAHGLLQQ